MNDGRERTLPAFDDSDKETPPARPIPGRVIVASPAATSTDWPPEAEITPPVPPSFGHTDPEKADRALEKAALEALLLRATCFARAMAAHTIAAKELHHRAAELSVEAAELAADVARALRK